MLPLAVTARTNSTLVRLTSQSSTVGFPDTPFDSALLPNGDVMASLSYIFDPTTDTFALLSNGPSANLQSYTLFTLPNAEVLVTGSQYGSPAFLFDPTSELFSPPINVPFQRVSPTANLLSTGQVLIAGGADTQQVDLYQPAAPVPAPIAASVTPNLVTGFSPVTITVQGANFAPGAVVTDFGFPLQTTFVSGTELTAVFPQSQLLLPGNHTIEVQNVQDARVGSVTLAVVNPQLQFTTPANDTSISLGNVSLGSSGTAGITFTNVGNAPLTLSTFVISGTNSADFSLAAGTVCTQGQVLAAQASCSVTIQFTPASAGSFNADLTVSYDTPSSPVVFPLSGTGIGSPLATLSTGSLTFGNQNIGTASAAQTVTVTNAGTAALAISNISVPQGYQQTNNCPQSLAPTVSCSVFVVFDPTAAGADAGTLIVTANDSGSPHAVQLTGTGVGVPASAIAPLTLTFGSQADGTSSAAQQVIVASIGTGDLAISNIALTDTADFKQTNNCPASLAPNTNCSIAVTFAPASAGSITGSLAITANDGSPHTISLSGTGTNFTISSSSGSSSSTTVPAGQPASYQMSLSPQVFTGTVALSVTEVMAIPDATATISPTQATLSGSTSVPITVTVTTTARSGLFAPNRAPRFPYVTLRELKTVRWILFSIMLLALIAASRKNRSRIPLAISTVFLLALLATGCGSAASNGSGAGTGGGSTGTPAGTYQLLVSASSSGVTKTMTLTLTVQ